jgi:hypothetical protein
MPEPAEDPQDYIPVNDAEGVNLPAGQKGVFVFKPDASGMWVDMVAASKYRGLTYEIKVDGDLRYGPAPIPPTDVDDSGVTHKPPMEVDRQLTLTVRNPSGTDRAVDAQIRGWES